MQRRLNDPVNLVQFGQFLDALVGLLQLHAALVKRFTQRACEDAEEHAAPDGQDEHQHGGEPLEMRLVRHRDRLVGQQKQRREAERHRGPGNRGLPRRSIATR